MVRGEPISRPPLASPETGLSFTIPVELGGRNVLGHYSTAFASKAAGMVPLWVLWLSVQLLKVARRVLVPLGIEKVRIEPGFMEMSALGLHDMP